MIWPLLSRLPSTSPSSRAMIPGSDRLVIISTVARRGDELPAVQDLRGLACPQDARLDAPDDGGAGADQAEDVNDRQHEVLLPAASAFMPPLCRAGPPTTAGGALVRR